MNREPSLRNPRRLRGVGFVSTDGLREHKNLESPTSSHLFYSPTITDQSLPRPEIGRVHAMRNNECASPEQ